MADVTLVAEIILHMIGVGCRCKVAFMAGIAIGRQRGELAVFVAAFAGNSLMRPGEGE